MSKVFGDFFFFSSSVSFFYNSARRRKIKEKPVFLFQMRGGGGWLGGTGWEWGDRGAPHALVFILPEFLFATFPHARVSFSQRHALGC